MPQLVSYRTVLLQCEELYVATMSPSVVYRTVEYCCYLLVLPVLSPYYKYKNYRNYDTTIHHTTVLALAHSLSLPSSKEREQQPDYVPSTVYSIGYMVLPRCWLLRSGNTTQWGDTIKQSFLFKLWILIQL